MTRVVQTSGFDYWESGIYLRLGEDMFDSFVVYQGRSGSGGALVAWTE